MTIFGAHILSEQRDRLFTCRLSSVDQRNCNSSLFIILMQIGFFLLATPFFYGVYGTIFCNWYPCLVQKLKNLLLTYSLPLLDIILRIWCLNFFSTKALKAKNMLKTSLLSFNKYTQVRLEKSSMKFKKYL